MLYIIKRMSENAGAYCFKNGFEPNSLSEDWALLETAGITDNVWADQFPDAFKAYAKVGWNEKGLNVLMYAVETPILARATGWDGRPCMDSCLEFFFNALPGKDNRYMNMEVNPIGGVCHAIGEGRHNRWHFYEPIEDMQINTCISGDVWAVSYNIPMSHIVRRYGEALTSGSAMKGNFYTCSESIHPHFSVWNHVTAPKPDFHRPECFGDIVLE